MKSKAECLLLPESVAQFFIILYRLLTKIIITNIPWKNLSNLLIVVLEKRPVNV